MNKRAQKEHTNPIHIQPAIQRKICIHFYKLLSLSRVSSMRMNRYLINNESLSNKQCGWECTSEIPFMKTN